MTAVIRSCPSTFRCKTSAGQARVCRTRHPQQVKKRRHKIVMTHQVPANTPSSRHIRPGRDHQHFYGHVQWQSTVALSPYAMMAHVHPIIADEKDQRILDPARGLKLIEWSADVAIRLRHGRIVAAGWSFRLSRDCAEKCNERGDRRAFARLLNSAGRENSEPCRS